MRTTATETHTISVKIDLAPEEQFTLPVDGFARPILVSRLAFQVDVLDPSQPSPIRALGAFTKKNGTPGLRGPQFAPRIDLADLPEPVAAEVSRVLAETRNG